MSNRTGVIGRGRKDVEPLPSPNRYIPHVTAEVRVFWPPNASRNDIAAAILAAVNDAVTRIEDKLEEGRRV